MKTINRFLMFAAMIVATACTTDDEPTEITGRYGNLTGESDTVITTYGTEPLKILHRM